MWRHKKTVIYIYWNHQFPGPVFEKKKYEAVPIVSLQIIDYQIDQSINKTHNWFNFILTASKMEFSYFLHMV